MPRSLKDIQLPVLCYNIHISNYKLKYYLDMWISSGWWIFLKFRNSCDLASLTIDKLRSGKQVVLALGGFIPLKFLKPEITPGTSNVSEYLSDSIQSYEDLKKIFMNMAQKGRENVIDENEYSDPRSKYGQDQCASSMAGPSNVSDSFNNGVQSMNMEQKDKEKVINENIDPSSKYDSVSTHGQQNTKEMGKVNGS